MPNAERRRVLKTFLGGAGATLCGASGSVSAAAVPAAQAGAPMGATKPGQPLESRFLSFEDEWSRFEAIMRITRSIEDEDDILFWYQHVSFVVPLNSPPLPVARFEGMEFTRHERVGETAYLHHGHNLSYPRDLTSGEFSDTALNPVTGTVVTVPGFIPEQLGPTHLLTPKGVIWTGAPSPDPVMGYYMIHQEGAFVVCDRRREEPHYAPANFMETSFERVALSDYEDRRIRKLPAITHGSFIWPYPDWLEMGDRPGHMLTTWSGCKLNSVAELPREFRERTEREYPHRLEIDRTAFWEWETETSEPTETSDTTEKAG